MDDAAELTNLCVRTCMCMCSKLTTQHISRNSDRTPPAQCLTIVECMCLTPPPCPYPAKHGHLRLLLLVGIQAAQQCAERMAVRTAVTMHLGAQVPLQVGAWGQTAQSSSSTPAEATAHPTVGFCDAEVLVLRQLPSYIHLRVDAATARMSDSSTAQ